MGAFNVSVVTDKGESLLAMSLAKGEKITFTQIKLSEYPLTGDLTKLTDLVAVKQSSHVSAIGVSSNSGSVQVSANFTNEELTEGYYVRNIGLYAKGINGEEILYSVSTADETVARADWMPPFTNMGITELRITANTVVTNTESVDITVNPSATATVAQITALQQQFNGLSLTSGRDVYVNSAIGSDDTGDGTESNPWKTIQKAVNECPPVQRGYSYRVNIADGEYTEIISVAGRKSLQLIGSQNENGVIIKGSIRLASFVQIGIQNKFLIHVDDPTYKSGVFVYTGGYVYLSSNAVLNIVGQNEGYGFWIHDGSTFNDGSSGKHSIKSCEVAIVVSTLSRAYIGSVEITDCATGISSRYADTFISPSTITNNAVVPYVTALGGKIRFTEQGWKSLGTVAGASSINIDSDSYTEFLVKVKVPEFGKFEYILSSEELTNTEESYCAGTMYNADTYAHTSIKASTTKISLYQAMVNGASIISTAQMAVYARRT